MTEALRTVDGIQIPAVGEWKIDSAHSSVSFSARHMMVSKVRGSFGTVEGTVSVGERPEDSSVDVEIDAATINTQMPMRDDHLRSPDFLDIERFPRLRFRSISVRRTEGNRLRIEGELTIRDVTRPVVLDAEYIGPAPGTDPRVAFSARTRIDREEFGITWNQALEAGGVLVGPTVDIEIDVALVATAEELAA